MVYGLLAAAVYTGLTLILRRSQTLPEKLSPVVNMAWVSLLGSLATVPEVLWSGEAFLIPDVMTLGTLIAYGALCSGLGWSLITTGLPRIEASRAGLFLVLQPTLAFVWDILFFARPTTAWHVAGASMTLFAIYLGTTKKT